MYSGNQTNMVCMLGMLAADENVHGSVTLPFSREHLRITVSARVNSISGTSNTTLMVRTFDPGPTQYYPTTVKWYEPVTLTFNGTELNRIGAGDRVKIVRDGNCSEGTLVAVQNATGDVVPEDEIARTVSRYHVRVLEAGQFWVCYHAQGESGETMLPSMLMVAGVVAYGPTKVWTWSAFELQVDGVLLDGSPGGDEMKIVRGGDCHGTDIVVGQGVQSTDLGPSDLNGLAHVSMAVTVTEAGHFTVCYRLRGSRTFVGLWPPLHVEAAPSDVEVRLPSSGASAVAGQSAAHVVELYNHGPGFGAPPVAVALQINGSLFESLDQRCVINGPDQAVCSIGLMEPGQKVLVPFGLYVEPSYSGEVVLAVDLRAGTDNNTDNNGVEWRVNAVVASVELQVLNYSSPEPSHHMRFDFRVVNLGHVGSGAYETDVVMVLPMEVEDITGLNVSCSLGMACAAEWSVFNASAAVVCHVGILAGQAGVSGWVSLGLAQPLTWMSVSGVVTSLSMRNAVSTGEVLVQLYTPGGQSFSPEWLPAYGCVTLRINGTELNTLPGGDSVKIVSDGVCNGGVVVEGGNETTDLGPLDGVGLDFAELSTTFYGGGLLTVCYRASGDVEYRALPGVLTVAGVRGYSPVNAWKHEQVRLQFEGVGLAVGSGGDRVKFVRDGDCDGTNVAAGSAVSRALESVEAGGGLVSVATYDMVFHDSGNVTACYELSSRAGYYVPVWPMLLISPLPSDLAVQVEALGAGAVVSGQKHLQGVQIVNRGSGWAEEATFVRVQVNGSIFAEYPTHCAMGAEDPPLRTMECVLGLVGPWAEQTLVFGLLVEPSYHGDVGFWAESRALNDNNTENNAASAWQSVVGAQLQMEVFEHVMTPSYHMSFGISVGNVGVMTSVAYDVEVVLVLPLSVSGGGLNVSIGNGCEPVAGVVNDGSIQVMCGLGDLAGGVSVVGSATLPDVRDNLWVNVSGYVQSINGEFAMAAALLRTFSPGPTIYSPTTVKWYEPVTLTFNGTELNRIGVGDRVKIVRDGNCSEGTLVAVQNATGDVVPEDEIARTVSRYHVRVLEAGQFWVCYHAQGESGETMLPSMLMVAGVVAYGPTKVWTWSAFELQVDGVLLDGSPGGDEMKIVRGGDCHGTDIVVGQGVQSTDLGPSDLNGLAHVSMAVTVTEAGHFTVCYRLRGSRTFVGLWPPLHVEAAPSDVEVRLPSSGASAVAGQSAAHVVELYNHGPGFGAPPVAVALQINGSLFESLDQRCVINGPDQAVCSIGLMEPGQKVLVPFGLYVEPSYSGEVVLAVDLRAGTDNNTDNNGVEWRVNAVVASVELQVLNYSSPEPSHHMRFDFRVVNLGHVGSVAYETDVVMVLPMEVEDITGLNVSCSLGMACAAEWSVFNASAAVVCHVGILAGQAGVSGWVSLGLAQPLTWMSVSGVVTSLSMRNAVSTGEVLVQLYTPGGQSFSPEWLPAYGRVTLRINGTELNTLPGGDSVKIVSDGVCNGGVVVEGGNETTDLGPLDGVGLDFAELSTTFYGGGLLTVCYRASGDVEYRALPGVLTVAGVRGYSPVNAWKHEQVRLQFEGVGLAVGSGGDRVKFVRDGDCDGTNVAAGSAVSRALESVEAGGGLVSVATYDMVFHDSGNVTACYELSSRAGYYVPVWPMLLISPLPSDLAVQVEALGAGAVVSGQKHLQGVQIVNRGSGWAEEATFVRVQVNGSIFAEYPTHCAMGAEDPPLRTMECVLGLVGPWAEQTLVFGLLVEPSYHGDVGFWAESWALNDNNTENNAASAWQSVVGAQLQMEVFEHVMTPSYHMSFGISVGNVGVMTSVAYDVEVVLVLPLSVSGGGLNVSIGNGCEPVAGVVNDGSMQVMCGLGDLAGGVSVVGSATLPDVRDNLWVNVSGYVQSISGEFAMAAALLRTFSPGPTIYSPTTVKWYEPVTLTFNGTELNRIGVGDRVKIVRVGNCSEGTLVAVQNATGDVVPEDEIARTVSRYHVRVLEAGQFWVCYHAQGESGETMLPSMLMVAGVVAYGPTKVWTWTAFELQVDGVLLDGSPGGDEMKIVRGGDCHGTDIVVGQGVQSTDLGPSDLNGLAHVSMAVTVTEAGHFTVCYRLRGSRTFVGLWPPLHVEAAPSDVEVRLPSSGASAVAGQSAAHVVELYNHGPGFGAPPVAVALQINGSLFESLDQRCVINGPDQAVCSIGLMEPGQKVLVPFGLYVEPSYSGEVVLAVDLRAGTDNNTDNNGVEWRVNAVVASVELQVLNYSSPEPSHHMRFDFRVVNLGHVGSVAYETDVVMVLPMEVEDITGLNVSCSLGMACAAEWSVFNASAAVVCHVGILAGQAGVSGWVSLGLAQPLTWMSVSGVVTSLSMRNAVSTGEVLVQLYTPGGQSFSPEWLPAYGRVTLRINGTELNTLPGGDSVKIVSDGVCNGGVVVEGGNETTDLGPLDGVGLDFAELSTTFYGGGLLTVCYRASGDVEYRALPGVLTVAGVRGYSPVNAWKHEQVRLQFEGVGLAVGSGGDRVKFVRDGDCDGTNVAAGSAVSHALEPVEAGGGLVSVATYDMVFHDSGNVTVCYELSSRAGYYVPVWPMLLISPLPSDLAVQVEALGAGAVVSGQKHLQGVQIVNRGSGWAEEATFVRVQVNGSIFAEYPTHCAMGAEDPPLRTMECVLGLVGPWAEQTLVFGLLVEPSYHGDVGFWAESWALNDNNTENNAASAWQSVVGAQLQMEVFEHVMTPSYHMSFGISVGNVGVMTSVAYDVEVVLVLPLSVSGGGLNVSIGNGCEPVAGVVNDGSMQVMCGLGDLAGGVSVVGSATLPDVRDNLWVNVSGYVQSISGEFAMAAALLRTFSPGPTIYSPTTVKWYEPVTLTFNGTELNRIGVGDRVKIVRDGNCSEGTLVAVQNATGDVVPEDEIARTVSRYHVRVLEAGQFWVCYHAQGESGETMLPSMLMVAGVVAYGPTKVWTWTAFELQVDGVLLDGSPGGDEMKIVRGGDCHGTDIVVGQGVQSTDLGPSDLNGLAHVSMAVTVTEAGHFTVCYRLRGSRTFVGLWPPLHVEAAPSDVEVRLPSSGASAVAGQSAAHVVELYNHGPGFGAPPVAVALQINGSLFESLDQRCVINGPDQAVCSIGLMEPGQKVLVPFGLYVEPSYSGEVVLAVDLRAGTDNNTDNNGVEWRVNAVVASVELQVLNYSSPEPSHHMRFDFRVVNLGHVGSVAYETDVVMVLPMEVEDITGLNVSCSLGMACAAEWSVFNASAAVVCHVGILAGQAGVSGWVSLGLAQPLTWMSVSGVVTSLSMRNAVSTGEVLVQLYTPGGQSFSPEWLPAYGCVTLRINGTELNTLPGGDSVKIVSDGVCNGGVVVEGGNETTDLGPLDGVGLDFAELSTTFYGGGLLTVCYRASGDVEYRALPGVLTVAGVRGYSPVNAWKHEQVRLQFEGVGLAVGSGGDRVKFVRDGDCDGTNVAAGSAVSRALESVEAGGGLVSVATYDMVFHDSGTVTVCYRFTPFSSSFYALQPPLSLVPRPTELAVSILASPLHCTRISPYPLVISVTNHGLFPSSDDTILRITWNGSWIVEAPQPCSSIRSFDEVCSFVARTRSITPVWCTLRRLLLEISVFACFCLTSVSMLHEFPPVFANLLCGHSFPYHCPQHLSELLGSFVCELYARVSPRNCKSGDSLDFHMQSAFKSHGMQKGNPPVQHKRRYLTQNIFSNANSNLHRYLVTLVVVVVVVVTVVVVVGCGCWSSF